MKKNNIKVQLSEEEGVIINWTEVKKKLKACCVSETFMRLADPIDQRALKEHGEQAKENFEISKNMLKAVNWSAISPKEDAMLKLSYILFFTEGTIAFFMNLVIYNLILREHHDVWPPRQRIFVSCFGDMVKVDLLEKEMFLDKHGFEFFSEICPIDIRNAVAHQNFRIESDGTIVTPKKRITKDESETIILNMTKLMNLFSSILSEK